MEYYHNSESTICFYEIEVVMALLSCALPEVRGLEGIFNKKYTDPEFRSALDKRLKEDL